MDFVLKVNDIESSHYMGMLISYHIRENGAARWPLVMSVHTAIIEGPKSEQWGRILSVCCSSEPRPLPSRLIILYQNEHTCVFNRYESCDQDCDWVVESFRALQRGYRLFVEGKCCGSPNSWIRHDRADFEH